MNFVAIPAGWLWKTVGSLKLTIWLIGLLVIDLTSGYFLLLGNSTLFEPMNQIGLPAWIMTYAANDLFHSGWFLFLLLLLALLAANTLVCTATRLFRLLAQPGSRARKRPALAAHVIHLGMVVILAGYLASYTLSTVYPSLTLIEGRATPVPGTTINIRMRKIKLEYYEGRRLADFRNRVITPKVEIGMLDTETGRRVTGTLSFNHPLYFQGYALFLQRFHPTRRQGMNNARYAVIDLRRDPGTRLYFLGILIFIGGLALYAWPGGKGLRGFRRPNGDSRAPLSSKKLNENGCQERG